MPLCILLLVVNLNVEVSRGVKKIYTLCVVGVVGEIWNHINSFIFNRGVTDASEVCTLMQAKVWSWISAKSRTTSVSFSNWCLEPLECMRLVI